jgi:hypothetical protein
MKITKAHRDCFKEALDYFDDRTRNFLCHLIDATSATEEVKAQCKDLLFLYFDDRKTCTVLWLSYQDDLTDEGLDTCRLIALYTLIYAPL